MKTKYQLGHESLIATRNIISSIFGTKNPTLSVIIIALCVFLISDWFPETISYILNQLFKSSPNPDLIAIILKIIFLIIFILALIIFLRRIGVIFSPITVVVDNNPPRAKVLLIFLSPIGPQTLADARKQKVQNLLNIKNNNLQNFEVEKKNFLSEFSSWSWEMPRLAIETHKDRLEKLYVLPSRESYYDFDYFKNIISLIFHDKKFEIELWPTNTKGVDFSDIKEIFDLVNRFYDEMRTTMKGIKENDIMIDITGGLVTTSVGAALATLTRGRAAEYVSTIDKIVRTYDITYSEED